MKIKNALKKLARVILPSRYYNEVRYIAIDLVTKKNKVLYHNWKKGEKYHNKYAGKRCFVVGNGPSLKYVDLSLLKDEYTFTVNKIAQLEGFENINTNFHVWADGAFFGTREEHQLDVDYLIWQYNEVAKQNPICFLPLEAYNFMEENHLNSKMNISYFLCNGDIVEDKLNNISTVKGIYQAANVVQYAVQIAIFLGFKEIYLLGCDATNIMETINAALGTKGVSNHAYENDNSFENEKEVLNKWSMTDVFYDQYLVFKGHSKLEDYCKKNGILLFNCTEQTLITDIPRKHLKDVLGN